MTKKQIHTHTIKLSVREEGNLHLLLADLSDHLGLRMTTDELLKKCIQIGFGVHVQAVRDELARKREEQKEEVSEELRLKNSGGSVEDADQSGNTPALADEEASNIIPQGAAGESGNPSKIILP